MDTTLFENYEIAGKIIDFFETSAIIELQNGQKITWPIKDLPEDSRRDTVVRIKLSTGENLNEETEKIAKALLNELLSGG